MKIISISINKRQTEVPEIQSILTKYGNDIYSRVGYHNIEKENSGLIIVIYTGQEEDKICYELQKIANITVNSMTI